MCKKVDDLSEVTELNDAEISAISHTLEYRLFSLSVKWIVIKHSELALWAFGFLQQKNISLPYLRRLLFSKWRKVLGTILYLRLRSREE
jgi:hypothetical protein